MRESDFSLLAIFFITCSFGSIYQLDNFVSKFPKLFPVVLQISLLSFSVCFFSFSNTVIDKWSYQEWIRMSNFYVYIWNA